MREDFENVHGVTSPEIKDAMSFYNVIEVAKELIISEDFATSLR